MPEVSVIMPVYNKAEYLAHGLQSILDQNFQNFELLIINDGSTDSSLSIIQDFAQMDSRICVFDVPNGGVSKARNLGLDHALGTYVTFIDADDYVAPEYLGNMYRILIHNDVDMVISGVTKYWKDRPETISMTAPFRGRVSMDNLLNEFAETQKSSGIFGTCVSKMYPRMLTQNIRFDECLNLAEDFDYYLRLYDVVESVYFDDKQYYYYLQEASNSSVMVEDSKIDYASQFEINVAYRNFLVHRRCFSGPNRTIVEEQLSNFLFLSLHYCPAEIFSQRFTYLRKVCRDNKIAPTGNTLWKKLILSLFAANICWLASLLTQGYHTARKIVRGVR